MLSIGDYLISIKKFGDDVLAVRTTDSIQLFKAVGEWGHEAWIESISKPTYIGEITEIRNDGWHFSIITADGYNDVELRVEYGYEGEFRELYC